MSNYFFILGDGDDIRRKVEEYLLSGDLRSLGTFSDALKKAIQDIADAVASTMSAEIIFVGGDDILFKTETRSYNEQQLKTLMTRFAARTGTEISFGVGPTIETAYLNLRRAKSHGHGSLINSNS
ncbi:MAG: mCpol domain-containing protein [bacterium]|nr:mCpol domain-containing protein [bacterium]